MLTRLRRRPSSASVSAWGRASLLGTAAAGAIVIGVCVLAGATFQEAFGANFLATLGGVALGVPVAVWLTLRETDELGKAAREQEESRATARRNEVLAGLRLELVENKDTLAQRRAAGTRQFFIPFLQDEVWAAMSDGGELRWVNDPALLRQIARSYLFIRTVIYLERQVFEIRHYAGMRIQGNDPDATIVAYLDHIDGVTLAAIDEGLAAIDNAKPLGDPMPTTG